MPPRSRSSRSLAAALDEHCGRLAACRRCAHAAGVRAHRVARASALVRCWWDRRPGRRRSGVGDPSPAARAARCSPGWRRRGSTKPTAREWLYIAAITRCYPGPHPSGRGDRVPTPRERERCSDWLDDELRIIRPLAHHPGRPAGDRPISRARIRSRRSSDASTRSCTRGDGRWRFPCRIPAVRAAGSMRRAIARCSTARWRCLAERLGTAARRGVA